MADLVQLREFARAEFGIKAKLHARQWRNRSQFARAEFGIKAKRRMDGGVYTIQFARAEFGIKAKQPTHAPSAP